MVPCQSCVIFISNRAQIYPLRFMHELVRWNHVANSQTIFYKMPQNRCTHDYTRLVHVFIDTVVGYKGVNCQFDKINSLGNVVVIKKVFCMHMIWMKLMSNSYEPVPKWMSQNTFDDKLQLVQVMAWCRQVQIHYPIQCWPSFMSPHSITKPRWVNVICYTRSTYYWAYLLLKTAWGTRGIDRQADFKEWANYIQLNSSLPSLPIRRLIFSAHCLRSVN